MRPILHVQNYTDVKKWLCLALAISPLPGNDTNRPIQRPFPYFFSSTWYTMSHIQPQAHPDRRFQSVFLPLFVSQNPALFLPHSIQLLDMRHDLLTAYAAANGLSTHEQVCVAMASLRSHSGDERPRPSNNCATAQRLPPPEVVLLVLVRRHTVRGLYEFTETSALQHILVRDQSLHVLFQGLLPLFDQRW